MSSKAPMPRRSKNSPDDVDYTMTVERVEATEKGGGRCLKGRVGRNSPMLLTLNDLADELGFGRRTVTRYLASGFIPPADVQVGPGRKGRRWRRDRIEAWIESGCPRADVWARNLEGGNS